MLTNPLHRATLSLLPTAANPHSQLARAFFIAAAVGAVAISGFLGGCTKNSEDAATDPATLNQWLDAQYEEELMLSPINLTFQGRKERNDELNSASYEEFKQQLEWKANSVAEMIERFDYAQLSQPEQLSYDLWEYQYQSMLADEEFFYDHLMFDQMNGLQSFIPTFMINFHKVTDADDLRAYISRLNWVKVRLDEAIEVAKLTSSKGVISPKFALDGTIEQSRMIIAGQPFDVTAQTDSDLWADFKSETEALLEAGELDQAQADKLMAQARKALLDSVMPGYENVIAWATAEIDKAPAIATGVGSNPGGQGFYEYRLQDQTTTNLSADEIHQIGRKEIARLRGEMEQIIKTVGFKGDLAAFFEHVREGEWNYYPDTDAGRQAYIDDATQAIDNIKSELPNFFGLLPKADLLVKRVESFRERDGAAQHYYPGTPDGSRPGTYYAHLSDMTAMPKNQLEVIAYHEGLPGHHMQISIAQELTDLPRFRTQAGFTAYSEGWALYAELLAKEIPGTYINPYQEFGQLSSEIWRAVRLVVDTGLHAKGWTEQQAVDFFVANTPEPLESVRSEIQRYIVMPGQATSYKIGMLKIGELRSRAESKLGAKFDIREFHDLLLGGGALPLPMLEARVDQWIASYMSAAAAS